MGSTDDDGDGMLDPAEFGMMVRPDERLTLSAAEAFRAADADGTCLCLFA